LFGPSFQRLAPDPLSHFQTYSIPIIVTPNYR